MQYIFLLRYPLGIYSKCLAFLINLRETKHSFAREEYFLVPIFANVVHYFKKTMLVSICAHYNKRQSALINKPDILSHTLYIGFSQFRHLL